MQRISQLLVQILCSANPLELAVSCMILMLKPAVSLLVRTLYEAC